MSDRFENDTGSLLAWGLTIRTAQCDPDVNAPDTEIQVAPPSLAGSRTASFEFTASKAGTQFQCRLDGGDFSPCTSPQQFGELPEGTHTFEVRAFDSKGNVDGTPAIYTWTIDVTAPAPRIASASGSAPSVQGSAGTASGDDGSVRVDLFSGSAASGSPVQTVVASRDGSGSFSAQFDRVAGGTYTVTARQSDAAGNSGSSSPVTFAVPGQASPPPPDFAVLSTEESMVDASAGRLTALSSCEGDCRRSSSLLVSSRTAGRLGLPRRGSRAVRLGGGAEACQAHPRGAHGAAPERRRCHGHAPGGGGLGLAVEGDLPAPVDQAFAARQPRAQARRRVLGRVHDVRAPDRELDHGAAARHPHQGRERGDRKRTGRRGGWPHGELHRPPRPLGPHGAVARPVGRPHARGRGQRRRHRLAPRHPPDHAGRLASPESPREGGSVVGVAQQVELLVVVQAVAGSSPVAHPPPAANRRIAASSAQGRA